MDNESYHNPPIDLLVGVAATNYSRTWPVDMDTFCHCAALGSQKIVPCLTLSQRAKVFQNIMSKLEVHMI